MKRHEINKKFTLKIKNYDLKNPDQKKFYNENLFTEVAPKYNFLTKVLSFGRDRAWKKMLVKNLPYINKASCLDIACGTGDITFSLAGKYQDGKVLGIDLNTDMINIARKLNKYPNIKFKLVDMCKTGLNSSSFDIITGGYALRNAPDLKKALTEFKRVMKKGAIAAFLDFHKTRNRFIQMIQLFFLKFWGNIWGIILHGNPEVYGYIADSLKSFPVKDEFEVILKSLGFKNIRVKVLFFGFLQLVFFEK